MKTKAVWLIALIGMWGIGATLAQAQKLSDADFKKIATSAKTPEDHKKLAAHYRAHAAEHEAEAKLHESVANQYRKVQPLDDASWDIARDAAHYAEHSREAAEALRDLAAAHESLAAEGKVSKK
jgi:hypothetical protein